MMKRTQTCVLSVMPRGSDVDDEAGLIGEVRRHLLTLKRRHGEVVERLGVTIPHGR